MKYTLTKLTDDVFEGRHPNGIYEGHAISSNEKADIVIGERYLFKNFTNYLLTSTVTEIVSETDTEIIFKTNNSTYKLITNV